LLNNYSEAVKWTEVALQLFKQLNSYDAEAGALGVLGDTYLKIKNFSAAVLQYKNALDLLNESGNNTAKGTAEIGSKADFYFSMGKAYLYWGGLLPDSLHTENQQLDPGLIKIALKNFELSLGLAKSKGYTENIANSLKNISIIQSSLGHYQEAFKTYKEYIIYRDSVDNSEKDKIYKQHELAFEYAKKRDSLDYAGKLQKKEIAQLKYLADDKLKQRSLYAIVAIVLLLLIASYFVFRNRIQKISFKNQLANEKAAVELKQALFENKLNDLTLASLKAQMNPHFIFNCLNSIKFYIENNDTEAASLYITKFSKLIRNILDSARSEKVMLPEEIELIKLYLDMEVMRLKNRLCYELVVDDNIDVDFMEIPPLFIQPYVENAVWHGIMNKAEGGFVKLRVSASPDQKYLVINITDNGVGRKRSAEIKSNSFLQHASHGTKLNNERIEIFNAKYKTNTEVTITDLHDANNQPCGTSVTIKLLTP
jgi:tetratricopeptide (TPR) repeat protein